MWQEYINATSIEQVLSLLAADKSQARIIAGGTDLMLEMRQDFHQEVKTLIDISRIESLDQITLDEDGFIHIGAGVTHNQCVDSMIIREGALPLALASLEVGAPQIRNTGTIVGNLVTASPANDTIVPLVALNAELKIRSLKGARQVALSDFYTGVRKHVLQPDEMVTEIIVPRMGADQRGEYLKLGLRKAQAISLVSMAVLLGLDEGKITTASITLGAVAPTIIHASTAEEFLIGKELSESVIDQAADLARQASRPIGSMRVNIFLELMHRLIECAVSFRMSAHWHSMWMRWVLQVCNGPSLGRGLCARNWIGKSKRSRTSMLRSAGVKRVLGELPWAAELDWNLRGKGKPVGGFKLEELREAHTKMEMRTLQILRTVEASGQRRDELFQEERLAMHEDYQQALRAASKQIQERLWGDLDQLKVEHERQIHTELRTIRRKLSAAGGDSTTRSVGTAVASAPPPPAPPVESFDYASFEERFRGDEQYVSSSQEFYLPYFANLSKVVDLGCGRGEFLAELASRGVEVLGVDLDTTALAACREKNLPVEQADIFEFLGRQADGSWAGIMCAHVIEHLPPLQLQELTDLCYSKLRPGGVLACETPNPGCLAIFAGDFYLDPTHRSPVPAGRMNFHLKESGFSSIETVERHPAPEVFSELRALDDMPQTAAFRQRFFGGLDYAIIARKPAE